MKLTKLEKVAMEIFLICGMALSCDAQNPSGTVSPGPSPGPSIASHVSFLSAIPDLTQGDPRTGFPGDGENYCAPVSVSNSLMWLAGTRFPGLVPRGGDPLLVQIELAKLLGSPSFMNTDVDEGTGTAELMLGVKKYIETMGLRVESLGYQGWRIHPAEFSTGVKVPNLDWIRGGIQDRGAVWINVGWYDYVPSSASYNRIGGHWVTLVGYGKNADGSANAASLIVHDPANRAGFTFENEFVTLNPIRSGTLKGNKTGLPRPASGFFRTEGGMHIKSSADLGIIDGVVRLIIAN